MSSLIQYLKTHQKISLIAISLAVFLICLTTHFFIYKSNGYAHTEYYNLLLARNWAQTGLVSYESNENVVLSTGDLITQGANSNQGNKLTWLLYGLMFRVFGFHPSLPLYISFFLYSLAGVGIFLLAWRLFGFEIGLVGAALYDLAPFSLPRSNAVGYQEWGWIFLVAAALIYFWPPQKKFKHLIFTAIFLGLATAAKNSYFIAFFPFMLLDLWLSRSDFKLAIKKLVILSAVFLVVITPFILIGGNNYLNLLVYSPQANSNYEPSFIFGYLFPDPYTFHYDKDAFLKNLYVNAKFYPGGEFVFWGDIGFFLKDYGVPVSFWQNQIISRIYSAWIYFKGLFLSALVFGGLLTWLFILIGLSYLFKKKNKPLIFFAISFFIFWLAGLIVLRTSNYEHLLILSLPLSLLVGVGIWQAAQTLAKLVSFKNLSEKILSFIIAVIIVIFFAQLSWWSLRELYASGMQEGKEGNILQIVAGVKNKNSIDKQGITAVGWSMEASLELAYHLDRNFITFAPQTVQKLAAEGKLNQVFKSYNITGFIGYNEQLTDTINKNTDNKLKNY